ncbi:MAG: cysteine-rich CWC family protein [Lysinibacillus sp.]
MKSNVCPICGEENSCMAGTAQQGNCWCVNENFPKEIFELVPEESKGQYCICHKCVAHQREKNNT